MPDRAVVDDPCPFCGKDRVHDLHDGERRVRCLSCNIFWYPDDPEPAPRALSAVSEDRQWLVVLEKIVRTLRWCIYRYHEGRRDPWKWHGDRLDTGQDAHEVLRDWERSRND